MHPVVTPQYIEITLNFAHSNVVLPYPESPFKTKFSLNFNPKASYPDQKKLPCYTFTKKNKKTKKQKNLALQRTEIRVRVVFLWLFFFFNIWGVMVCEVGVCVVLGWWCLCVWVCVLGCVGLCGVCVLWSVGWCVSVFVRGLVWCVLRWVFFK